MDGDDTPHGKDTDANIPHDYHHEDTGDIETIGQEHHNNLASLTWELDDLHHRVQTGESQPTETLHHIEHELQRLPIALCPSALPEPPMMYFSNTQKPYVLPQKQTTFTNTLIQDTPTFNGSNSTQLGGLVSGH